MSDSNIVQIFDTTLRDGEQSPGASMTMNEKVVIARKLEALGVDIIEAGFPASSPGEFKSVTRIAEEIRNCRIAALCRTREQDIERAWRAIESAADPVIHTFIATSEIHLEHKLKMSHAQVLEEIRRGVSDSRARCPRVEFSAEDATRSDIEFLKEAVDCAIKNGATVINIPDTVGYTMPDEYRRIITAIREVTAGSEAIISVHCHNDLGLAVANSLSAIAAGARQVECCVNGLGERAGNAALEEVVAAIKVRADLLNVSTRIVTKEIMSTSKLVSNITGIKVQRNKAVVGKNAFAHEAGIHQHGMLSDQRTYEIMRPEDIGLSDSKIVLGKHSGRSALINRLEEFGYDLNPEQIEAVFVHLKKLADKKDKIYDEDLHALVAAEAFRIEATYKLESIMFSSGSHSTPTATVTVTANGESFTSGATGDGPVNAAIEAIKKCTGRQDSILKEYSLDSLTDGSDAQGQVRLAIIRNDQIARGRATHTDVVVASAKAFVDALNHQEYMNEIERRIENGGQ